MLVYSDSDWAGCLRTRKSTSGGVLTFQGGSLRRGVVHTPVLRSQAGKQNTTPSCEQRAKSIASRTGLGKLRHLEIKFLWLQEAVRKKKVVVSKVRGDVNPQMYLPSPVREAIDFAADESTNSRILAPHPTSRMIDCIPNDSLAALTRA